MTPETATKEIEEATSDLQAFAALNALFGSEYAKMFIAALAKVEELAINKVQGRRK
jgi:hypothetical protein